jgi:hypothetical protein
VREYLGVFLQGARDATVTLRDVWDGPGRDRARDDYLRFLAELQQSYAARAEALERALHEAMNLEMEVVRDRLTRRRPLDSED